MNSQRAACFLFALAAGLTQTISAATPAARNAHTAVWTGTEMIIWGGADTSGNALGTGARNIPTSTAWTAVSTVDAPSARYDHTAVWTGTEMIIWGGRFNSFGLLGTGARYNPALNLWTPMNTNSALSPRVSHRAVWTGSEMIVWGGTRGDFSLGNDGARYNPATDSWTLMTTNGGPLARTGASVVWTGNRMVVWGGYGSIFTNYNDGARYDPVGNNWSPISSGNAPTPRYGQATIWTGSEMVLWGGYDGVAFPRDGGRYHAASDSWTAVPTNGAPSARAFASAVWTGSEMIIWGGGNSSHNTNSGGRYHVTANTWAATATNGAPAARTLHTAVWSGSEMLVWGGKNFITFDDGGHYDPVSNLWPRLFLPAVETLAPSGSAAMAMLNGMVNPSGSNTAAWFEWGTNGSFGKATPARAMGSGTSDVFFNETLTNTLGGVTYHYRVVASNSAGRTVGAVWSFTTPRCANFDTSHFPSEYYLGHAIPEYDVDLAVKLTAEEPDQVGSLVVGDLSGGALVTSLDVGFQLRMGNNTEFHADGFSFVWATDMPAVAFGEELYGGVSLGSFGSITNISKGLVISFDTFSNDETSDPAPAVDVVFNGTVLLRTLVSPTNLFNTGFDYANVAISVTPGGRLYVRFAGIPLVTELPLPGFQGLAGARFGWGARTGGFVDHHYVDDICLTPRASCPPSSVRIQRNGPNVLVTFAGTLQSAPSVTGPWTNIIGAANPYPSSATGQKFFRAVSECYDAL